MTLFFYKAKDKEAHTISGEIEARNQEEAIDLLSQRGLLPVSIVEKSGQAVAAAPKAQLRKIRPRDIMLFSRNLAHLLKAGVPILKALGIMEQQSSNANWKKRLVKMQADIKEGRSFSESLAAYPDLFNPLYVSMIRVGEEGGNLKDILLRLAGYAKGQEEIRVKVRNAMAYPTLMLGVGLLTVIFVLTFVLPRLSSLFANYAHQLPLLTRCVMAVSDILKKSWIGIFLAAGCLIVFLKGWLSSPAGHLFVSRLNLSLPVLKELTIKVEMTRFCRTQELLLKSGVPLLKALRITLPILENDLIRQDLARLQKDIEVGNSLGGSLKSSRYVPGLMLNAVVVAEEAGLLEETFRDLADTFEEETAETIKTAMTLLEPLMILAVGSIIGIIVVAMLLPILQMDILA